MRISDWSSDVCSSDLVAANQDDRVTVPEGYTVDVLLKAGDSVETGTPYSGSFPASPAVAEKWAGGGHDGMDYFAIPDADATSRGLLAMNYEYPDFHIFMAGDYDPDPASTNQKAIPLPAAAIGVAGAP